MKLTEYADVIRQELEIHYYPSGLWTARFKGGEVKDGPILISEYGRGNTPQHALDNYISHIRGTVLVFNATGGADRREYSVPASLEKEE